MYVTIAGLIALIFIGSACTGKFDKKLDRRSVADISVHSSNNLEKITTEPTNPDGGLTIGRRPQLTPEQSFQRKLRNELHPIVFGVSAGGISMSTTVDEADKILANPTSVFNGIEFYPEDLRLQWGSEAPRTPILFVIGPSYKGKLDLGGEIGEISMGTSFKQFFDPEISGSIYRLLKQIGRHFEGQSSAAYDCELAFTCRLEENDNYVFFEYKKGGLLLSKTKELSMDLIYYSKPRVLRPSIQDPLIYNQSIAGITRQTTKTELENRLGAPVDTNEHGVHYYDNYNIAVIWNPMSLPSLIMVRNNYRGKFNLAGFNPSTRGVGDSFANLTPNGADEQYLARVLHRIFENKDEDCIALASCSIAPIADGFEIQLKNGFFGVSSDSARRLIYFGMNN